MSNPGALSTSVLELSRVEDRLSFLYLERSVIHRESNAITATDERGTVHIPGAGLSVLLLGPGTTISHQAMMLLAESGATAVWVGERGVRYYAHGRALTLGSKLLDAQAALVSHRDHRLRVARAMYAMRFPGEDVSGLNMQQLRGREGARVRKVYKAHAAQHGVEWSRRSYDVEDFEAGDPVNQALTAANASLYGVVHSVIVALGCAPGLGFVHMGHGRSFVYDIADLYKAELTIPLAFELAADPPLDIGGTARRRLRDLLYDGKFLKRCVRDIQSLLLPGERGESSETGYASEEDTVVLWDGNDVIAAASAAEAGDSPPELDALQYPGAKGPTP